MSLSERLMAVAITALCLTGSVAAQDSAANTSTTKSKGEHFAAVAILPRASARTASHVDIRFQSYSSDEDTQALANVLSDGGRRALRRELEKRRSIGSISLSHRTSFYKFKLVRSSPTDTGRRIIAVADRPIGFLENYYSGRSVDYDIGIVVLDLKTNDKGKEVGEGTMLYAAKVRIKDGKVELEHLDINPIRLTNARKY